MRLTASHRIGITERERERQRERDRETERETERQRERQRDREREREREGLLCGSLRATEPKERSDLDSDTPAQSMSADAP